MEKATKNYKISFCTVSMNRLIHLKETLIKNISDNLNYENIEFVILDYNSNDGLYDWAKDNLGEYIEKGIVKYFRTEEPKYFHRSHSRNAAFKLATGDIVCNVDADNFMGVGFAKYINDLFCNEESIVLTGANPTYNETLSVVGRVCVLKDHFKKVRGFDEEMENYGWEDIDFLNRLKKIGLKSKRFQHSKHLNAIEHSNILRFTNEAFSNNVSATYIRYLTPTFSKVLVLLNNNEYILSDIGGLNSKSVNLSKDKEIGTWEDRKNKLNFYDNKKKIKYTLNVGNNSHLKHNQIVYYKIIDKKLLNSLKLLLPSLWNKYKLEINERSAETIVNSIRYGEAVVYEGFSSKIPATRT